MGSMSKNYINSNLARSFLKIAHEESVFFCHCYVPSQKAGLICNPLWVHSKRTNNNLLHGLLLSVFPIFNTSQSLEWNLCACHLSWCQLLFEGKFGYLWLRPSLGEYVITAVLPFNPLWIILSCWLFSSVFLHLERGESKDRRNRLHLYDSYCLRDTRFA